MGLGDCHHCGTILAPRGELPQLVGEGGSASLQIPEESEAEQGMLGELASLNERRKCNGNRAHPKGPLRPALQSCEC